MSRAVSGFSPETIPDSSYSPSDLSAFASEALYGPVDLLQGGCGIRGPETGCPVRGAGMRADRAGDQFSGNGIISGKGGLSAGSQGTGAGDAAADVRCRRSQ